MAFTNIISRLFIADNFKNHARCKTLGSHKTALLYSYVDESLASNLVNGAVLALIEAQRHELNTILIWLGSLLLVTSVRAYILSLYRASNERDRVNWDLLYALGTFVSGVVWGMAGLIFFSPEHPLNITFIAFILGGMAAGSVAVLSPVRCMATIYIVPMLAPLTYCFLKQGDIASLSMAFLVCCFGYILISAAKRTHSAIDNSLTLSIENQKLVDALKEENERVDKINSELVTEVNLRSKAQKELKRAAQLLTDKNIELDRALHNANLASEAKSNFLATVSHEIRTPLNAVIGMTDLVLTSNLQPEQREQLNVVVKSANSLLIMFNDILDLSKIEADDFKLTLTKFKPRDVWNKVIESYNELLERSRLEAVSCFSDAVPEYVIGDPERLAQVLSNLISNSIKFTKADGVIICYLEPGEDPNSLLFAVADTGIGVPPENIKAIFEPFTQGERYGSRIYGGAGLGLSLSGKIVNLLGGELKVVSRVGIGSRFFFTVPTNSEKGAEVEQARRMSTLEEKNLDLNVLIVDDNVVNQKLFAAMLKQFGCKSHVAENGEKALQELKLGAFDLILMDCQMPVMDGYEATKNIRKLETKDNRVPIVALTANVQPQEREMCFAVGMDGYLPKPINRKRLYQTLLRFV